MKKIKKLMSMALAAVLSASLAACGSSTGTASSSSSSASSSGDTTLRVIATSENYKELFDKFTEDTGINVEFLSMSSGEVISRVTAEEDNPMADVWFGGGVDAFMEAKDKDLLAQCNFEDADKIDSEFKDSDNYWFSKGLTVVGFIVNKDVLKEKNLPMPTSWDDLTNPIYKDEIIMSNPAVSGTNYAVVNAILQTKGEDAGWEYFKKINDNISSYSKRGSDPSTKTLAGEYAIGITYIDRALEEKTKEQNVEIVYPSDGMPWVPDGVAMFKNAQNKEAAEKFMAWVFTDENLKKVAEIDAKDTVKIVKPSLEGVDLTFAKDKLMKEDLSLFGSERTSILDKWDALTSGK